MCMCVRAYVYGWSPVTMADDILLYEIVGMHPKERNVHIAKHFKEG